jgi:hypothetical protein
MTLPTSGPTGAESWCVDSEPKATERRNHRRIEHAPGWASESGQHAEDDDRRRAVRARRERQDVHLASRPPPVHGSKATWLSSVPLIDEFGMFNTVDRLAWRDARAICWSVNESGAVAGTCEEGISCTRTHEPLCIEAANSALPASSSNRNMSEPSLSTSRRTIRRGLPRPTEW